MAKFVPLEEAATQLGVSKDRLNELREAGKLRGYRDGSSWKFREDELQKAAADLTGDDGEGAGDSDSILVSDAEVGESPARPPSTVIGDKKKTKAQGDSDLELSLDDDGQGGASDVLAGTSGSNVLGPSETPPVSSGKFEDLDEIEIDLETESSKILSGDDLPKPEAASPDEPDEDLQLVESGVLDRGPGSTGGGSEIKLADDEDDDLVLSESGGSDVTLGSGDSGINLVDPADSGIELDEMELDLSDSNVSPLEPVSETEEEFELEEVAETEDSEKGGSDDFLLTPLGDSGEEESSSQVIMIEDSQADVAEDAAAILGGAEETAVLEPVEDQEGPQVAASIAGGPVLVASSETQFPLWVNLLLGMCVLLMLLAGMMIFDLMRNMWGWQQPFSVTSTLIDALNIFG